MPCSCASGVLFPEGVTQNNDCVKDNPGRFSVSDNYREGEYVLAPHLLVTRHNLLQKKASPAEEAKRSGVSYKPNQYVKAITIKNHTAMKPVEIKKILLPTDFSETGMLALEQAVKMARLLKAQLYLLHVVEAVGYTYSSYETEAVMEDIKDTYTAVSARLNKLAHEISKKNGIQVTVMMGTGRPSSGIKDAVKENDIDLIIMGTHGAKGFEEYFIGSNAHKVVNLAPCPVITIQKNVNKSGFKNIVMPIDNSLYSRQKVNYVTLLASLYNSQVHILGLLNDKEGVDEYKFGLKLDSVEKHLKKAGVNYLRKVVKGTNIASEAIKYSDEVNADLIVIMTDHESALKGAFMGVLAKQIVNHSKIPVLSIRPLQEGHLTLPAMSAASPLF